MTKKSERNCIFLTHTGKSTWNKPVKVMDNFRNLIVWKRSVELATDVYRITVSFPKFELYGLTSQVRRAAVSISSNIAEGAGRR